MIKEVKMSIVKKAFTHMGLDPGEMFRALSKWSITRALGENGRGALIKRLREIVPDISEQERNEKETKTVAGEIRKRSLQAFQCSLMVKSLQGAKAGALTVVDIGDSAGTHMSYLKELMKDRFDINTISVNLNPEDVEKVRRKGLEAILCRAEELDLGDKKVDLFTSFQMVEHLHNPASFFRRLAKKSRGNKMVITVPYLKTSRVGLHHVRIGTEKEITAGDEHIFELSPNDWRLLMLHAGWRVVHDEVYYQYPRKWPLISSLMGACWRAVDYEGFWGAILEKDTTVSDRYIDWEE